MSNDPFLTLNEDDFFAILTVPGLEFDETMSDVAIASELYLTYGKIRKSVFDQALSFFQKKYHPPGVSLQRPFLIATTPGETNDEKALLSLVYSDFPEFVSTLKLDEVNEVLES